MHTTMKATMKTTTRVMASAESQMTEIFKKKYSLRIPKKFYNLKDFNLFPFYVQIENCEIPKK